jgi:DNA-binding GntR family transcriptional regulator
MNGFRTRNLAEFAANELRRRIISGEMELGRRVTEREVSEMLDIGRMPAREALIALEHEGLIVSNSESRSVVSLDADAVAGLFEIRSILETMAVAQAAAKTTPERAVRLEGLLNNLRFGCERQDSSLTTSADLALHEEIWAQSNNMYLERCLRGIRGVVFVLVKRGSTHGKRNWEKLYQEHGAIVRAINEGQPEEAARLMRNNLQAASKHSIMVERLIAEEKAPVE